MKGDPFRLSWGLAAKLGSLVVHLEEGLSKKGHAFDAMALKALLADPEIQDWLAALPATLLPVKR